jgi:hypothetical protein
MGLLVAFFEKVVGFGPTAVYFLLSGWLFGWLVLIMNIDRPSIVVSLHSHNTMSSLRAKALRTYHYVLCLLTRAVHSLFGCLSCSLYRSLYSCIRCTHPSRMFALLFICPIVRCTHLFVSCKHSCIRCTHPSCLH